MIDITGIKIREVFVHRVGNLFRNEGVSYSELAQQIPQTNRLPLVQFLFGNIGRLNSYKFTHSVSSELNTVATLATSLSVGSEPLKRVSVDIATHLYSVSNHPRVKAGNLFVGIFDGIKVDGRARAVLGIFKSDAVDDFIKVDVKDGKASLKVEQGAAMTSLDKVGLVFLSGNIRLENVFSACARGEDAVFWNDRFLQLAPAHSARADTKACLDICRNFFAEGGGQIDDSERILFLNRSIEFFENSERYDEAGFASVFTSKAQEKEFKKFKVQQEAKTSWNVPADFAIEKAVVRKERNKFERNVKLDSNIEIRLRFKNRREMNERVEQGFDEERKMAFYKLYYEGEE